MKTSQEDFSVTDIAGDLLEIKKALMSKLSPGVISQWQDSKDGHTGFQKWHSVLDQQVAEAFKQASVAVDAESLGDNEAALLAFEKLSALEKKYADTGMDVDRHIINYSEKLEADAQSTARARTAVR